jgi:microcystin-dependent protein
MTSTTGGSISILSNLSVPTITSNTNITGSLTIQYQPVSTVIVGEVRMTLSNTPPPNFLLCNGQSVLKTDYPNLFSVIGYNYGGSGANFNLPNLQSRYPIGANGFNGVPQSNFATGNGESGANNTYSSIGGNTLPTWSEVPIHSHNISDPQHAHANSNYSPSKTSFEGDPGTLFIDAVEYTGHDPIDTSTNVTNLTVSSTGTNLAPVPNDTVSSLKGVNVSLSYVAVNYCIAY